MNPAMQYFWLMQQQNQPQSPALSQEAPSPLAANTQNYNPFDEGIRKAMMSARESMAMTDKQQAKAFRGALLNFAQNMSQQPVTKGFFNNFGAIGKALGPALGYYDQQEENMMNQNHALANDMIKLRMAEQARQDQLAEQAWRRQHAENQLSEQRKHHQNLQDFKSLAQNNKHNDLTTENLRQTLNDAEKKIQSLGNNAFRGRGENLLDKFLPGGYQKNSPQSEIDTLGDIIKGQLFNSWGYRNQAEFEHVPTISSNNSPETNKAIIQTLKRMIGDTSSFKMPEQTNEQEDLITVIDPTGKFEGEIPAKDINQYLQKGYKLASEVAE